MQWRSQGSISRMFVEKLTTRNRTVYSMREKCESEYLTGLRDKICREKMQIFHTDKNHLHLIPPLLCQDVREEELDESMETLGRLHGVTASAGMWVCNTKMFRSAVGPLPSTIRRPSSAEVKRQTELQSPQCITYWVVMVLDSVIRWTEERVCSVSVGDEERYGKNCETVLIKDLRMLGRSWFTPNVWPKCTTTCCKSSLTSQFSMGKKQTSDILPHISWNNSLHYHFLKPSQTTFPHDASFMNIITLMKVKP